MPAFEAERTWKQDKQGPLGARDNPALEAATPPDFGGGIRLTRFKLVSDAKVPARRAPRARPHVCQCDLRAAGIADFGGVACGTGRRAELFCDDEYMTLARYPNDTA